MSLSKAARIRSFRARKALVPYKNVVGKWQGDVLLLHEKRKSD